MFQVMQLYNREAKRFYFLNVGNGKRTDEYTFTEALSIKMSLMDGLDLEGMTMQ